MPGRGFYHCKLTSVAEGECPFCVKFFYLNKNYEVTEADMNHEGNIEGPCVQTNGRRIANHEQEVPTEVKKNQ